MPDRSSEREGSHSGHSSSSEREASETSPHPSSIPKDIDSLDPEQDDLVGEKPLDDRFTEEQLERLIAMKDEYRHAGKKQRRELAHKMGEAFASEIIASGKDLSQSERGSLMEWVKKWFAQRARSRKEPIRWSIHWSARMVLYKEQPERVIETQKRLYEVATGKVAEEEDMGVSEIEDIEESVEPPKDRNPKPFHFFQRALTAEWDSLSEKEQQSYEEKARLWRSLGPDESERRRMAEEHAPRTIRSLATNLYRQMGVRMFILATWEDTQGRVISVPLDFNHELGSDGRSYKIEHRAYLERIGLLDHYASFAQKNWPDKTSVVDRDVSPMEITFNVTADGRPVLPDPTLRHPVLKPFKHLPNLVRKFVDASYGLCRGIPVNRKGGHQVPWQQLQTRAMEFIDSEYLPDGFSCFKDPGQLGVNVCRMLLQHWWDRQQNGDVPFEFHHWEASPPVYEADGVTLKTPAKMVPAETLPLVTGEDPSEDEQVKPKPKPKRSRKKKTKTSTSNPNVASSTRKKSLSRSPSKSNARGDRNQLKGKKAIEDETGSLSDEDSSLGDVTERSTPVPRGRTRERRQTPTDLVAATEKLQLDSSPNPSDMEQEADEGWVEGKSLAEQDRIGKVNKGPKASTSRSKVTATTENDVDGDEIEAVKKSKPTKSRAKSRPSSGKGKKDDPKTKPLTKDPARMGRRANQSKEVAEGSEEEQGDGEAGLKKTRGKQGDKTPRRVKRTKNVQWDDLEKVGAASDEGEPTDVRRRGLSPRKQTAEERDLLAIANSSRYKVDSPKRRRSENSRYKDSA